MAKQSRATLKSYFQEGDEPTEQQFADLIDTMLVEDDRLDRVLIVNHAADQYAGFKPVASQTVTARLLYTDASGQGAAGTVVITATGGAVTFVWLESSFTDGMTAFGAAVQPDGTVRFLPALASGVPPRGSLRLTAADII